MCQALFIVNPFSLMPHLLANMALCDRMLRIPGNFNNSSILFMQQQPALIRAVQRAYALEYSILCICS
ncbi:Uncharacterised protein [Mycobacteroides abscessus subsp. abscessus]|nr:Uncharacterised protein [Mycobacteroides abscessus subsp. abscessus]